MVKIFPTEFTPAWLCYFFFFLPFYSDISPQLIPRQKLICALKHFTKPIKSKADASSLRSYTVTFNRKLIKLRYFCSNICSGGQPSSFRMKRLIKNELSHPFNTRTETRFLEILLTGLNIVDWPALTFWTSSTTKETLKDNCGIMPSVGQVAVQDQRLKDKHGKTEHNPWKLDEVLM